MLHFTLMFSGFLASYATLSTLQGVTKLDCARECLYNHNCSSFFFSTLTGVCQLEKFVYPGYSSLLSVAEGFLYYTARQKSCPNDYIYSRTTNQCLKLYSAAKLFVDSQATCDVDSGHLVYILTQNSNTQVHLLAESSHVWIGGHEVSAGVWKWLDGQTLGPYTNWMDGKPDGGPGQSCLILRYTDGLWDDHFTSWSFPAICQIDTENDNTTYC